MEHYTATPCACGSAICPLWHIKPYVLSKEQAFAVVKLLNEMEDQQKLSENCSEGESI